MWALRLDLVGRQLQKASHLAVSVRTTSDSRNLGTLLRAWIWAAVPPPSLSTHTAATSAAFCRPMWAAVGSLCQALHASASALGIAAPRPAAVPRQQSSARKHAFPSGWLALLEPKLLCRGEKAALDSPTSLAATEALVHKYRRPSPPEQYRRSGGTADVGTQADGASEHADSDGAVSLAGESVDGEEASRGLLAQPPSGAAGVDILFCLGCLWFPLC